MLMAGNDRIQAIMTQLEDTCKTIEENSQRQKQSLSEHFDLLYAILEEKKGELQSRITLQQEEKTGYVRGLVQQFKEQLEGSTKLVESAIHSMEETGIAAFLLDAKKLIKNITDACKQSQVQMTEPGFECMDHFTLSTEHEEAMLRSIDFGTEDDEEYEEEEEEEEVEGEDPADKQTDGPQ
ncbi:E3 ubiquitin-protein ligase TRIM63-like [Huso huso]|uniref:RING-type E3 ubiquitin transferase n=1 Tax=Huso huso TaxID=61971 RepID=A0ABR0YQU9_HUSHU